MDLNQLINEAEPILKVSFKDKNFLYNAFVHRSYLNESPEKGLSSNERLEFLGDAILELWISDKLYHRFPHQDEGFLTNLRAKIVRTESLAEIARKINLGKFLSLSKGEDQEKGRENPSILANTFEAVIGAIFLDQGINGANNFLETHLNAVIEKAMQKGELKDPKTIFQEKTQAKFNLTPHYRLLGGKGPDHKKTFISAAFIGDRRISLGKGRTKQESEEKAARLALEKLFFKR